MIINNWDKKAVNKEISIDMGKIGIQLLIPALFLSILNLIKFLVKRKLCLFLEDHGVRWTSIGKMADMLAFLDFFSYCSLSNAARYLSHPLITN